MWVLHYSYKEKGFFIIALKMFRKFEKHKYHFGIKINHFKENFIFLEGLKTPVSSM